MFEHRKPKFELREPMKICSACGVSKDVETEFYWVNGVGKGWPQGRCKVCFGVRQKEYRQKHAAKYAKLAKDWRRKNPEKAKAIARVSNAKTGASRKAKYLLSLAERPSTILVCRDCGQSKDSKAGFYRCEQPCRKCRTAKAQLRRYTEEGKAARRKEYLAHRKEAVERAVKWAKSHPEKVREYRRRAGKTEHGRRAALEKNWRRRAKVLNAVVEGAEAVTTAWFKELCAKTGNQCSYCADSSKPLTMDHIVPLARGGKHIRENITPACKSCNCTKSDRTVSEWLIGDTNNG